MRANPANRSAKTSRIKRDTEKSEIEGRVVANASNGSKGRDPTEELCESTPTGGFGQEPSFVPPGGLCRVRNRHFDGLAVNLTYSTVHVPVNIYDGGSRFNSPYYRIYTDFQIILIILNKICIAT